MIIYQEKEKIGMVRIKKYSNLFIYFGFLLYRFNNNESIISNGYGCISFLNKKISNMSCMELKTNKKRNNFNINCLSFFFSVYYVFIK